jgi:signal transduction histidine kinase
VMVDMKWTLGPHPGVERLAMLEVKLEAALREAAPAIIACQYDRERFPGDIIREIIAIHPLVIDEQAVCRNPYYVSPEVYLAPDWPARELNWLLESIRRFQRADDASRASEQRYRSLARNLLELQERERQSLARELHDDLGQILTVIRFELQQERGEVATGRARVDGAIALVDQAVEIVRDLARELRPSMLDHLGLAVATRSYATRWAERAGWEAHLTIEEMERRLPPAVETACFSCACLSQIPHGPADRTDERALKWT